MTKQGYANAVIVPRDYCFVATGADGKYDVWGKDFRIASDLPKDEAKRLRDLLNTAWGLGFAAGGKGTKTSIQWR